MGLARFPRLPLVPGERQRERELRAATANDHADRRWRRHTRRILAACFLSQIVATLIGVAGFAVSDEGLGSLLLAVGRGGVVFGPFAIAVVAVVEARRRGDV